MRFICLHVKCVEVFMVLEGVTVGAVGLVVVAVAVVVVLGIANPPALATRLWKLASVYVGSCSSNVCTSRSNTSNI